MKLTETSRAEPHPRLPDLSLLKDRTVRLLRPDSGNRLAQPAVALLALVPIAFAGVYGYRSAAGEMTETILSKLDNLLGNAWKFTGKTDSARIELGRTRDAAGQTVYFVRDNGAGFDMAYAHKLFAPFQRLHAADDFPGTGIGLATVHRIVRRHGGRIWAEGAVNRGAAFYFTLDDIWQAEKTSS